MFLPRDIQHMKWMTENVSGRGLGVPAGQGVSPEINIEYAFFVTYFLLHQTTGFICGLPKV
jgi:hypothetical protein